jgi:hypothetical protein
MKGLPNAAFSSERTLLSHSFAIAVCGSALRRFSRLFHLLRRVVMMVMMHNRNVVVMMAVVVMMHGLHLGSGGGRSASRGSVFSESNDGGKHKRRGDADRRKNLDHSYSPCFGLRAQSVQG